MDKADKFYKVRTMSNELNRNCAANYYSHREISLDEMSPQSSHRCNVTKRTKHKKVPSAIDVKAVTDAHNGYTIQHRLSAQKPRIIDGLTTTGSEVIELIEHSNLESYSEIFLDNLYASVPLFSYIFQKFRIYCTGTIFLIFFFTYLLIHLLTFLLDRNMESKLWCAEITPKTECESSKKN